MQNYLGSAGPVSRLDEFRLQPVRVTLIYTAIRMARPSLKALVECLLGIYLEKGIFLASLQRIHLTMDENSICFAPARKKNHCVKYPSFCRIIRNSS